MSSPTSPSFFADITTSRKILKVLHWDKLKNNSGKKTNCVARMLYKQKTYWAVSGGTPFKEENIQSLVTVLNNLPHTVVVLSTTKPITSSMNFITVNPNVYLYKGPDWVFVSYDQYVNKMPKQSSSSKHEFNTRLFSCCERKLISAVDDPTNESFTIAVIKPPCELCFAAKVYLNNPNFKLLPANLMSVEAYDEFKTLGLV